MTSVTLMRAGVVLLTALLAVVCTAPVAAQQTTGNVRGERNGVDGGHLFRESSGGHCGNWITRFRGS